MDVCMDKNNCYWPQIVDYKQIINENSNSIFILNKRNPEELLSSFKRWKNYDKRLFKYNPNIIIFVLCWVSIMKSTFIFNK